MGINDETDASATLQIGPTSLGMVRLFVEQGGVEVPMDFTPDEADEIAEEIRAAAAAARLRGGRDAPAAPDRPGARRGAKDR